MIHHTESQEDWRTYLEGELSVDIVALMPVSGGDFAQSFQASLDDGRQIFVKTHQSPPPFFFSTEAAGLTWLRQAKATQVPEVILVSDSPPCLALEWIDTGDAGRRDEATFGRQLSDLHANSPAFFGRQDRRTTGSLALPNEPCDSWPEFYRENRLLPLARIATDRQVFNEQVIARLERIAGMLEEFGAADEPPARLHGDLWAGNRLVDGGGDSWLIDPAAHGGHREFDLSMMRLFGGFGDEVFRAYEEVTPLAEGWQQRIKLHQLAPLVVHAIKFGGSYVGATGDALKALLR